MTMKAADIRPTTKDKETKRKAKEKVGTDKQDTGGSGITALTNVQTVQQRLSKYEYAQVIGVRTEMLARGAPPLVHLHDGLKPRGHYDIRLVAEEELKMGVLPFDVVRQSVSRSTVTVPLYT